MCDSDSSDDDILVPNGFVDVGVESVEVIVDVKDPGSPPKKKRKKKELLMAFDESAIDESFVDELVESSLILDGDNADLVEDLNDDDDDSSDLIECVGLPQTRSSRSRAKAQKKGQSQPKRSTKKTPSKKTPSKRSKRSLTDDCVVSGDHSDIIDLDATHTQTDSFVISPDQSPKNIFDISSVTPQSSFCLDDDEPSQPTAEDPNCETIIRVLWKGCDTKKFTIRKFQKIKEIFTYYADLEGVKEERILFTLHDKPVTPNDTPFSLNPGIASLEGGIIDVENVSSQAVEAASSLEEDPHAIKVFVQRKGVRDKHAVSILPHEQISVMISKLSEDLKIPYHSIKLMFDGDVLDANQTATDYDIEGDECIDLILK